jgi:hypothetical protein
MEIHLSLIFSTELGHFRSFDFARRQSSVLTKKLSVSFQEPFETTKKKRKVREDDSELEEDDEKEKVMDSQAFHEKKEKDSELFVPVKEWIDPLLDMTMDSPQRITRKMLKLRMCIEKALKKDELTEEDEKILWEAIEKVKIDADDNKGISSRSRSDLVMMMV